MAPLKHSPDSSHIPIRIRQFPKARSYNTSRTFGTAQVKLLSLTDIFANTVRSYVSVGRLIFSSQLLKFSDQLGHLLFLCSIQLIFELVHSYQKPKSEKMPTRNEKGNVHIAETTNQLIFVRCLVLCRNVHNTIFGHMSESRTFVKTA
jgi:hypothetical protein